MKLYHATLKNLMPDDEQYTMTNMIIVAIDYSSAINLVTNELFTYKYKNPELSSYDNGYFSVADDIDIEETTFKLMKNKYPFIREIDMTIEKVVYHI